MWGGGGGFQSGLVPIYHLSGSKITTWDPVATHTHPDTNPEVAADVKVVLEETEFYHFIYW